MKTVTTTAMAKVAAVATGLAMATSMLSLAPIAHAAFSKDLTIGSRGAEVTELQTALIAGGYSIPAGATGYFGAQTRAAVSAWQKANNVSPTAGYFGAKSRATWSGTVATTPGTPAPVTAGTGTGLKVMLSPTSPNGTVLVQGQAVGNLADFTFANPTSAPINVTALSFKRIGVSNDSTLTNVYLYNAGMRITDSAGVSSSAFSFADPVALFTVPAGQTYTVSVRSDILTGTSGQQIGVQLVSATSNGTLDASVSFPVNSGYQTISAASLAAVDYNNATASPTGTPSISPQNDYSIWQETISVSTNPVKLSSMRFTNLGSIDSAYVTNLRLYVDGVAQGAAVASMSGTRTVTFDLSASPVLLSTSAHTVKVLANITGGSSRTIQMSVQRASDAMFVDSQLGQPVTPTKASSTFGAVTTGVITISSVSGSTGVSVSRNQASPNQAIAVGATNVKWATFDMLASGESVKVSDLYVSADTSIHNGGLANGRILVNGVQVGSTKAIGELTAATTDFSLGSSLILPAGQTVVVDIFADAKTSTSTNLTAAETVTVSIDAGTSNAQGQMSLNSANVPGTITSGNQITVSASSLNASKYTGYGNQTVVAGSVGAKLGAFVLSTGATEGVTVNTISLTLTTANAASITNLTLKDDATGNVLGTVVTTPSGGTNGTQFSTNFTIALSSSKTISIYGNILSGANAGPITISVDTSTAGVGAVTGLSAAQAAAAPLQTVTVGSGTLGVTRAAGDPTSTNVIAGATNAVKVGQFNFAAANSAYTVQNLAVLIPNSAATSVTAVTLSYKDAAGATQTATQGLAVNAALPYATATFTGLTMNVPINDSANLDVFVGTPTIASGATSGAAINVTLDTGGTNTTFRAVNSAGASLLQVNSGVNVASNGTFYVRKSVPTLSTPAGQGGSIVPINPLYRFTVSADAAGAIEWTKLVFTVATTSTTLSSVYLVDESSSLNILDNQTTSASTTQTTVTVDLTKNSTASTYQQVAAGSSKTYALYGTVGSFGTGAALSIRLTQDTSPVANGAASASGSTSWSDRSAASHTTSTTDWTNGYLLQNFTTNSVSYSK